MTHFKLNSGSQGRALMLGLAALALCVGAAQAQIAKNKGPIDITGDSMDVRDAERLVVWKGKVEALQDHDRLRTDLLNIYYKPSNKAAGAPKTSSAGADFGDIDHMEAIGDVYYVTPTQVARGDRAVYSADTNTIVMTGNVVVTQGENVGRGARLVINLANNTQSLEGGAGQQRPRVVYYPKKKP